MQGKMQERPTLKKYLENYRKLKKVKSTGSLLSQRHNKQKSKEELLKLVTEKLLEVERLLQTKPQLTPCDKQIMTCVIEARGFLEAISITEVNFEGGFSINDIMPQIKTEKQTPAPQNYPIIGTQKHLLSPIQLNKNFDSLTISASQIGTKYLIPSDQGSNMRFGKFGSIADNSGKSLRRMDIGSSIRMFDKTNSIAKQQVIDEKQYEENLHSPLLPERPNKT